MPKHHRKKPAEASSLKCKDRQTMLEHTESAGSAVLQKEKQKRRHENAVRKHNSDQIHAQAHDRDTQKHHIKSPRCGPKSILVKKTDPDRGADEHRHKQRAKKTADQTRDHKRDSNRSTDKNGHKKHMSRETSDQSNIKLIDNQTNANHRNVKYYPNRKEWPEYSSFRLDSFLSPEDVPPICSPPELLDAWYMITAKYERFHNYQIPFMTSESVKYAIWKHQLVNVASGGRSNLILAWDKKIKRFLVIKLFTKHNKLEIDELVHRATARMFLNRTHSTPEFCGLIYVGDSCTYDNFGIVEEFVGSELRPTTLLSFLDNLFDCGISQLPEDQQSPILMRVVTMCINLVDQLQKIHDYGAVLNTIRPETILVEFEDDTSSYAMPYFAHLTDVTFRMDFLGSRRASDAALTKLEDSSKWLRLNGDMKDRDSLLRARRSDDMFEIGEILIDVARITKLSSISEIGESLFYMTSSKRIGCRRVRIQLAKTLRNLEEQQRRSKYSKVHVPELLVDFKSRSGTVHSKVSSWMARGSNSEDASVSRTYDDDSSSDYTYISGRSDESGSTISNRSRGSSDSNGSSRSSNGNSGSHDYDDDDDDDDDEESADDGENYTDEDSSDQTERSYDYSSSDQGTCDDSLANALEQINEYERKESKANRSKHAYN